MITRRPAGLALAICCLAALDAHAQARDFALKGVTRVTVNVAMSGKEVPTTVTTDRLRTLIELKLRSAGLMVVSPADVRGDPEAIPSVELTVITIPARSGLSDLGWVFSTRLAVREYRPSLRNSAIVPVELWSNAFLHITETGNASDETERVLNLLLDQLANEWLKANPGR